MVLNEVYTGAGLSATMVPEMDFEVSEAFGTLHNTTYRLIKTPTTGGDFASLTWTGSDDNRLVKDLYKGCLARVESHGTTSGTVSASGTINTLRIKSNSANTIVFNQILGAADEYFSCTILSYGAPVYAPAVTTDKVNILADNWLGLVNTVTPPTVDVELKQSNLALGGTRNFGHQFKGAETVGAASLDVSLNNGMWLYYALGDIDSLLASSLNTNNDLGDVTGTNVNADHSLSGSSGGDWFASVADKSIRRAEKGIDDNVVPIPDLAKTATRANWKEVNAANYFTYDFKEANSGDLPSFALEVTAEKGAVTDATYEHGSNENTLFSRIYTGCQVNSFTMSFEEGQEVKATIDAVSRKAHDSEAAYIPKRKVRTPSALFNYNAEADNNPFMFSDGTVELFGQSLARVKSGTLTITNNLTPQRFIGNYDRTITSTHIAGQRTYDVTLNMLITDREVWDILRKPRADTSTYTSDTHEISDSTIKLRFDKSEGTANTDYIEIKLDDYMVTMVDIPFPEDKGPLEVSVTISARTLNDCKYAGKWAIQM